ncbi:hypothetical protein N7492_007334 [Penicillium capsulatum]|uniref:Uncharacterized protein n=1 Tax=Penicillium capsulatum TaxID=69766 RepID=A0A9W9LKQ7_9EURO|nr:hypothetical protein N7492_007334 [Penicillium capsulatum]KAJ6117174.1 hypothetical protein N7512_006899 [Penicillium capsulatum]
MGSRSTSMAYSALLAFPIPASVRRRLPRWYLSSHRTSVGIESGGDLCRGLESSSEPHLSSFTPLERSSGAELHRPSTASEDSFDSGSGPNTPSTEPYPAKYETDSGVHWNRVVPAFGLLRNAGYEAQQSNADGRLARSLYINALMYLLDALPTDLSADETVMLKHRLPEPVRASIAPPSALQKVHPEPSCFKSASSSRSYLHRLLASTIVQVFLLVRLLLPYFRLLLHRIVEYERSHRITERVVTATLCTVDRLGGSSEIATSSGKSNKANIGTAVGNMAMWWVEGVAGGIQEGVGEGLVQMGLPKQGSELDQMVLPVG